MANILTVVSKSLHLGPHYHTVLAEAGQRIVGAIQYGLRSSRPRTPSLKASSDSPSPSVRTPCYFYIPGVLLCPMTLNTPDYRQAFPLPRGTVSTTLQNTRRGAGGRKLRESWWGCPHQLPLISSQHCSLANLTQM